MKTLNRRFLLPVLVATYSMNFMDRSVLGIVGDALKADLGLSDGQLGLLHSILLITLIFLLLPAASLGDLVGRRRLLSATAALWTGAMALTGTASGFVHLICARALGSVNEASMGAGGTAWLSAAYPPEQRGRVVGLFQTSAPLGMALGTLLGGLVLALTGSWRTSFFVFLLPGAACAILIPLLPDTQTPAGKGYLTALPGLLRLRTLLICGVGAGFYCLAKFAYQSWLPVLLLRSYDDLSPILAGAMAGAFLLIGAAGPVLGGSFSDILNRRTRAGRVYAIVLCMALVTASKFVLYYLAGRVPLPTLFAYGLFDGLLTMMPLPIYFTMIQDVVEDRFRGGAVGLFGVIVYVTGGAWGPVVVGFLSDLCGGGASGLRSALLILTAFMAASVFVFATARNAYMREKL